MAYLGILDALNLGLQPLDFVHLRLCQLHHSLLVCQFVPQLLDGVLQQGDPGLVLRRGRYSVLTNKAAGWGRCDRVQGREWEELRVECALSYPALTHHPLHPSHACIYKLACVLKPLAAQPWSP